MRQKDIILLVVSFSALIIIWVGLSVYHNIVTSTIPETLNIQITPINPSFDDKTISDIKNREKIIPSFEQGVATSSSQSAK